MPEDDPNLLLPEDERSDNDWDTGSKYLTLLTGSAATREGILDGLESVFNNSFENDVISDLISQCTV